MSVDFSKIAEAVGLMNTHLETELLKKDGKVQEKKLWKNTFTKKQIKKREENKTPFETSDHIRAMVYSLLSAGTKWDKYIDSIDLETGKITDVDEIFHQYKDLKFDLNRIDKELKKKSYCLNHYIPRDQAMEALNNNIKMLFELKDTYGSVDSFYDMFIKLDPSLKTLVSLLSSPGSKFKLEKMGVALTAEYLKNIGHSNISKPDTHIRNILGSEILGCSNYKTVPEYEAIDIVAEIAKASGKQVAEVDYILWSYCADGYGICRKPYKKCEACAIKDYCQKHKK